MSDFEFSTIETVTITKDRIGDVAALIAERNPCAVDVHRFFDDDQVRPTVALYRFEQKVRAGDFDLDVDDALVVTLSLDGSIRSAVAVGPADAHELFDRTSAIEQLNLTQGAQ